MFKGCFVAVVTPFRRGEIDERAFKELIRFLVEKGVDGIVPCGTTGESPALSREEQRRLIKLAVKEVRKRVAVIAGTGSNNTKEAEELTAIFVSSRKTAISRQLSIVNRKSSIQKGNGNGGL